MLTSLKIHWLKWQIKVLLRLKQLEDRRSRNRNPIPWVSLHEGWGKEVQNGKSAQM